MIDRTDSDDLDPPIEHWLADSPFRRLDWRWVVAQSAVCRRGQLHPSQRDASTVALFKYLRAEAGCRTERARVGLETKWPGLRAACNLAATDGPMRWEVQARILSGQSDDEIAQ